jgi:TonB family protein
MKTVLLLIFLFAGAATAADAQQLSDPDWVKKPSRGDIEQAYPLRAKRMGTLGRVILSCTANDKGQMTDCEVTDENPKREGFGAAALKLTPKFQMPPVTKEGLTTAGSTVNIGIEFKVDR